MSQSNPRKPSRTPSWIPSWSFKSPEEAKIDTNASRLPENSPYLHTAVHALFKGPPVSGSGSMTGGCMRPATGSPNNDKQRRTKRMPNPPKPRIHRSLQ